MKHSLPQNEAQLKNGVATRGFYALNLMALLALLTSMLVSTLLTGGTVVEAAVANPNSDGPLVAAAVQPHATVQVTNCSNGSAASVNIGTLGYALSHYNSGDSIVFACSGGTSGAYTIYIYSTITIANNLTLDGNGYNVTLDGLGSNQIISVSSGGNLTLNALTIANGVAPNSECGQIQSTSNYYCGGGIYNQGKLTVTKSTFHDNTAPNTTGIGGAIFNESGATIYSISNSTFYANAADSNTGGGGGALDNHGTIYSISNTTFYSNSAPNGIGGAIDNVEGSISSISNSTFYSNTTIDIGNGTGGGAIYNDSTISSISNSTFYSNAVPDNGDAAIYNDSGGSMALASNIFEINNKYNKNCYDPSNGIDNLDFNLADDNSCVFHNLTSRNNVSNLNLGTLGNYGGPTETIPLLAGSAAIGAVTSNCPATDQRGFARPSTNCAAGAFEIANSTITLNRAVNPSLYSQPVTLTATINPITATGTVRFSFSGTPFTTTVSSGAATYVTNTLAVGSTVITATYNGDNTHFSSTSNQLTQTVTAANTTTSLSTSSPSINQGQSLTFTATVASVAPSTATPDGSVIFTDTTTNSALGSSSLDASGVATFTSSSLSAGTHNIIAGYSGDTNFKGSVSSNQTVTVFNQTALTVNSSANPSTYGQSVTFTATIATNNNSSTVKRPRTVGDNTVSFSIDGNTVASAIFVNNNVATYTTSTLSVGSHSVVASYTGNASNNPSTSTAFTQTVNTTNSATTLISAPNPASVGQAVTLIAVVNPATATGSVTFTFDNNIQATAVLNNGIATYLTNTLSSGSHNITAYYNGDSTYSGSTSNTVIQQVVTTPATIAVSAGSNQSTAIATTFPVKFAAIVRDGSTGNPLPGVNVVFQAPVTGASGLFSPTNSTTFTATTDANGVATASAFVANNTVGSYQVSASTAGATSPATFNLVNNPVDIASSYTYYLPFVANNAGNFTTYLAFQNIGSASANITVTYYDNNGSNLAASTLITQVAQYAEALPANPFASGKQGTGIITSDQPLNVIVPEATPYGGSAYAVSSGSSNSLIAPFALNNAFGDFTTQLNIFNGGASAVTATVTFYGTVGNSTTITSTSTNVAIQPHTTANLNQNTLPSGFSGWAQISGSANTLVAQVLEQSPSTKFVAIANAVASPSSSEYAPAVFDGGYGGFYTGANIINPNASAVTVTVTYYDLSANALPTTPFVIAAHGVASIFNGSSSGNGIPNGGLPKNFIGSMAVSAVGGNIAMSVNENGGVTSAGNSRSGTYAAIANGSSTVGLPVVSNGGFTYVTGDTILNTSSQPVSATINYYDVNGKAVSGASKSFTIAGHGSQAYYQGDGSLPSNFYGTAVITETGGAANSLIVTTNAQNIALFYTYSEPNS